MVVGGMNSSSSSPDLQHVSLAQQATKAHPKRNSMVILCAGGLQVAVPNPPKLGLPIIGRITNISDGKLAHLISSVRFMIQCTSHVT